LQNTITDLGTALAQAFIQGQDAAEAMHNSLKSIAATAASSTINNLIKGDLGAAAISGTVALGATIAGKLFGSGDERAAAQPAQPRPPIVPAQPRPHPPTPANDNLETSNDGDQRTAAA
jgi:hypothetical protein